MSFGFFDFFSCQYNLFVWMYNCTSQYDVYWSGNKSKGPWDVTQHLFLINKGEMNGEMLSSKTCCRRLNGHVCNLHIKECVHNIHSNSNIISMLYIYIYIYLNISCNNEAHSWQNVNDSELIFYFHVSCIILYHVS